MRFSVVILFVFSNDNNIYCGYFKFKRKKTVLEGMGQVS